MMLLMPLFGNSEQKEKNVTFHNILELNMLQI